MHFVPWKTIDLDGAFRITAPDSISEEVIQEVSNGITFKFNGKLEKTNEFVMGNYGKKEHLWQLPTKPEEYEQSSIDLTNFQPFNWKM